MDLQTWLPLLLLILTVLRTEGQTSRSRVQNERGKGRQKKRVEPKVEVVSCRVFKRGVCSRGQGNLIGSRSGVLTTGKCQQLCFATQGCGAFTYFERKENSRPRCLMFKECKGKRDRCQGCVSGPIMPRVTECLSARQVLGQEETVVETECPAGCTPTSICGDQSTVINNEENEEPELAPNVETQEEDYEEVEYVETVENGDEDIDDPDVSYEDGAENVAFPDEEYEAEEVVEDNEIQDDVVLPTDGFTEEEEAEEIDDVEINIDPGLMKNEEGVSVELPNRVITPQMTRVPILFGFIILGGMNTSGLPENVVEILSGSLRNLSLPICSGGCIPALPISLGEVTSSTYSPTSGSLTACGTGVSSLSAYGYVHTPGSCMEHTLGEKGWGGGPSLRLTQYRKGASIEKVGRYLVAVGGRRNGKALKSLEVFDSAKPRKGWRRMGRTRLPSPLSDHCSVSLGSDKGEIVLIGGREREDRVLKLNLKDNRWFSLNRPQQGRRSHACTKARINGRPGLLISGGLAKTGNSSSVLSSVEFYDLQTGDWVSLPRMRQGRSGHVMTVSRGRLVVAGGQIRDRQGRRSLTKDIEVFQGRRWSLARQKLQKPRTGFSLVKVPMYRLRGGRKVEKVDRRKGTQPTNTPVL